MTEPVSVPHSSSVDESGIAAFAHWQRGGEG